VNVTRNADWGERARRGFLASGIDPADRRGHKNLYIDTLQKMALEEALELKGNEIVLDFGCGSGRMTYWLAPRVRKVIGLEVTPEMIRLAEERRKSDNVEFMLYDGVHFPVFPDPFDFILSVGVLQIMEGEGLKKTLSELARCLKPDGKVYLVEQVSDNPAVGRPSLSEYLKVFEELKLEVLQRFAIRNGRWWLLYLIRYGVIPRRWFARIAKKETRRLRTDEGSPVSYYRDFLFVLKKP
jgi:SAM-dependent methyltransferase